MNECYLCGKNDCDCIWKDFNFSKLKIKIIADDPKDQYIADQLSTTLNTPPFNELNPDTVFLNEVI